MENEPVNENIFTGCTDIRFEPDFTVVDETNDYIVVDKPAPLQVHPSVPGNPPTLLDGLQDLLAYDLANGARLSIINRLDRETSGIVIVAKNRKTARLFNLAMQRRQVAKEYTALVWGWPEQDAFTVGAPLRRKGEFEKSPVWVRQAVHPDGAVARTGFSVLERLERKTSNGTRFTLVRAWPETGRMHQIRVHLAHVGHPVIGDKIYGPDERCYLEFIETGWGDALQEKLLLPRQALHCQRMEIRDIGAWETAPPVFW